MSRNLVFTISLLAALVVAAGAQDAAGGGVGEQTTQIKPLSRWKPL